MALNEGKHTGEFLLSEGNGSISRENIVISSAAGALAAGTVLSAVNATGTAVVSAAAGNTGDATLPTVTVSANAAPGRHTLTIVTEGANAGTYRLEGPDGALVGIGTVAAAFADAGLAFTLADGANDWDNNDRVFIDVSFASTEYVAYEAGLTADGILYANAPDSATDQKATMIARMAEVIASELTGSDAAAKRQLLSKGIVYR